MFHIPRKGLAALIAVLALTAIVVAPGFAEAEGEVAPTASPSGEVVPFAEESCPSGSICVWPQTGYQGPRGETSCSASGNHVLGGTKKSAKNRCGSKGVGLKRNGEAVGCVGANQNAENYPNGFNELLVFESANC